jgi:hypothetical protein
VKICEHCQRLIKPDEECRSYDKLSISAGGFTFHYHLTCAPTEIPARPATSRLRHRTRDI